MVRQVMPEAILIEPGRNTWFTGGNNIGIQKATGNYVLILQPGYRVPKRHTANHDGLFADTSQSGCDYLPDALSRWRATKYGINLIPVILICF